MFLKRTEGGFAVTAGPSSPVTAVLLDEFSFVSAIRWNPHRNELLLTGTAVGNRGPDLSTNDKGDFACTGALSMPLRGPRCSRSTPTTRCTPRSSATRSTAETGSPSWTRTASRARCQGRAVQLGLPCPFGQPGREEPRLGAMAGRRHETSGREPRRRQHRVPVVRSAVLLVLRRQPPREQVSEAT